MNIIISNQRIIGDYVNFHLQLSNINRQQFINLESMYGAPIKDEAEAEVSILSPFQGEARVSRHKIEC